MNRLAQLRLPVLRQRLFEEPAEHRPLGGECGRTDGAAGCDEGTPAEINFLSALNIYLHAANTLGSSGLGSLSRGPDFARSPRPPRTGRPLNSLGDEDLDSTSASTGAMGAADTRGLAFAIPPRLPRKRPALPSPGWKEEKDVGAAVGSAASALLPEGSISLRSRRRLDAPATADTSAALSAAHSATGGLGSPGTDAPPPRCQSPCLPPPGAAAADLAGGCPGETPGR